MFLTKYSGMIIGPVASLLGLCMNGIFSVLNMIGLPNIGLSIIIMTILIYMAMLPLTIKQQKFSKLQRKMQPLRKKIEGLVAELKSYQTQVDALEAGIVSILGFHVSDLVKKVIEPTGKTDANGKPLTVTKYLPTSIVSYDEQKKEYVINTGEPEATFQPAEATGTEEHGGSTTEAPAEVPSTEEVEEVAETSESIFD